MKTPPTTQTSYTITVPIFKTWATGTMRGTGIRTFEITEEATIMGGIRAIDAAIALTNGKWLDDCSPTITPNPAELGWPLGVEVAK